jgi:hypothetical protein
MGFWLKCPGCQAKNPLSLRVCPHCGRSLDNLPPDQRVYVVEPPGAATPEPSSPPPPASEIAEPQVPVRQASESSPPAKVSKGAKKPRSPRKKKE